MRTRGGPPTPVGQTLDPPAPIDPVGVRPGVFRREGEYWTIGVENEVCRLRDSAGLRYLAVLLMRPGESVPAADLVVLAGRLAAGSTPPAPEPARARVTHALRDVLRRLALHHAAASEHLRATITTGSRCAYRPDARRAIAWEP